MLCKGVDDDESTIARKHKCSFQKDHWCVQSEKCISKALKCNGVHDCLGESTYSRSDISDEEDCKSYSQACPNSHFRCTHSNACISKDYLCDGINHCGDYQDEKLDQCKNKTVDKIVRHSYNLRRSPEQCPLQKECVSTQTNEIICLTESLMCNNRQDCVDGEDEGELCDGCSRLTNEQKRDCQHCINSPEGPICQCQQNDLKRYVHVDFFKNSSVCSGIDFCQFLGTCDQICESNVGREMGEENPHFECKCRHGWKLDDEDKRTCSIAFEPFASIIPNNKHRHSFLALDTFGNLRLLNGHGVVINNLLEEASARVVKHLQSGGVDSRPRIISAWLTDSRAFDRLITGYYGSIDTLPLAYIQADFDGYDSLYVLEISKYKDDYTYYGMGSTQLRTYEIRFDLPPMYIDAIALTRNQRPWGYAYNNYNRIYVSGNMPLYNKNLYTIHLVLENGFAVKLYESTEKISCLLHHGISNLLYFSENNQLRVLQFKNNTESQVGSELIHSFEGRITALKNDESFEKLWIVLDNSQVFFIDYHGISTPVEISLRPKLTTINDITICESSLYVSDSESKFLWRYNKFSGIQDEANAKQLQQVTDDPLAASNVEYLWLHNVKNEKLGLKKNTLDKSPNVSVVIGKEVKDFRADWEKNAVEGNLNANLCSPDLVNRFFSTRNGYNNSGYLACDEDYKLVEFDYDGAAMDHTPEIEVICNQKKGIHMLGENVHFTECVDNSGFRHDVFYQNETECKNDCTES